MFRDRSSLPAGEGYDARIRAAIEESDLFVFLVSRESVAPGRYTLTELKFAERRWGTPAGHVLPVLVEEVAGEAIPPFLLAVTVLRSQGNLTAEVAAEVARMSASGWRRMLEPRRLAPAAVAALVLASGGWIGLSRYLERREHGVQAQALVTQARLLADARNYLAAWETLERADAPGSREVTDARERLAMDWLDHARDSQFPGGLKGIAEKVLPVLSSGAVSAKGERSADLLAHMGWADFFRSRGGVGGLDPAQYYRRALEIDAKNVFAHAMWAHHILAHRGPLAEAKRHFAMALESGREREYVRGMQIYALLWDRDSERDAETIRVANEIRSKGEPMPVGALDRELAWDLWNVYYDRIVRGEGRPQFLAALQPADHVATFRWLYPVEVVKEAQMGFKYFLHLSILGQLQENAGDGAGAVESYRLLLRQMSDKKYSGMIAVRTADDAKAAIKRLSR